ncbi:unnamed protein product [Rangifer tarandus platyrhynchus]|uniref:Uncharacterized protein n=1 Tax=Rangifer tarandus platyrhynchus TaxID=3082113 RepID=A0AC60A6V1_RANTA
METHLNRPLVLCCLTLKKYVNIRALPEVTFTIHGVPYSLQPTVCTLLHLSAGENLFRLGLIHHPPQNQPAAAVRQPRCLSEQLPPPHV